VRECFESRRDDTWVTPTPRPCFMLSSRPRSAGRGEEVVVNERSFVFAEAHLLYAPVQLSLFDAFQRIFRLLFVVDVEVGETAASVDESPEDFLVVIGSHPVAKDGRQGWGTQIFVFVILSAGGLGLSRRSRRTPIATQNPGVVIPSAARFGRSRGICGCTNEGDAPGAPHIRGFRMCGRPRINWRRPR